MASKKEGPPTPLLPCLLFILLQVVFGVVVFLSLRGLVKPNRGLTAPQLPGSWPLMGLGGPFNLTILLWVWPSSKPNAIRDCPKLPGTPGRCRITADHHRYPEADVVLVPHQEVSRRPKRRLPREPRPPSQLWVWFNWESPSNSPRLSALDHLFNLTMSYRRDSDIFVPYGWLEVLPQPQEVSVPPKSKLAAWVVSNWKQGLRRTKYYRQLKKFLPVDLYGRRHRPLPPDAHYPTLSQYKFYLAFENSLHQDYITEKLWKNALEAGSVPVVLGPPRENYERYLPPEAFIHVEDFPSAWQLAAFLRELDRNQTRYERYFQWRRWLKPVANDLGIRHFCRVCQELQGKAGRYQRSQELSRWFR